MDEAESHALVPSGVPGHHPTQPQGIVVSGHALKKVQMFSFGDPEVSWRVGFKRNCPFGPKSAIDLIP